MVKYDTIGKIIKGNNLGWFVKIVKDVEKSGGIFIYEFPELNGSKGFDNWLENPNDVHEFINENGWKIKWED